MGTRNAVKTVISISFRVIIIALLVILIYYASGMFFRFGKAIFNEQPVMPEGYGSIVSVSLPEDPSVWQVAEAVADAGAVGNKYLFYVQALLAPNYSKYLEGGTFEISTDMKPAQILARLTEQARAAALEKDKK